MRILMTLACAASLGACAYNVPISVSPNLNVYSSYSDKIPGDYLLYVDASTLQQTVHPIGIACSANNYPVDARDAFKASTLQTVQQLVGNVQLVDQPVPASQLHGRGMILVHADSMTVDLQFVQGFWNATIDTNADITASASVDMASGRVFGTTASGTGRANHESGSMCDSGAGAAGRAVEAAMRQVLGQLGERMSNAPRLRQATASTTGAAPPTSTPAQ